MTYVEYNDILMMKKDSIYYKQWDNDDNSFMYDDGYPRMHFFRNIEYAKKYLDIFGQMIVKCNVPDNLIEKNGYGYYHYKGYSVRVPIPEFIIKRSDFSVKFIKEINPNIRNNLIYLFGFKEVELYDMFLKRLYNEWKNENYERNNDYDFCYYVVNYLKSNNLDDILREIANDKINVATRLVLRKR